MTTFENKCRILSELWLSHRDNQSLKDFLVYNDLALPLAFMIEEGIVDDPNELAKSFVDEAFDLLLKASGVEDLGFDSLNGILGSVEEWDGHE